MGTLAVVGKFELYFAIMAGMFVVEALSVIIQVSYFKKTGKRIFKMSPLHHHFELCGLSEREIVKRFAMASVIFSVIGYFLATGGH